MTRANIPHFGRPFGTNVSENDIRALFQVQGNFQGMTVEWPLLLQNTGTGGARFRIDPSAFDRPAVAAMAVSAGVAVRYFKIIRLSADTTTDRSDVFPCRTFDPFDPDAEGVVTWIAKIWFLRGATTWDGVTRLNIKYFYSPGIHHKRTALLTGGDGTDFEEQSLVPAYAEGDIIRATKIATGLTVSGADEGDDPIPVVWEEDASGRMWMVEP